MDTHRHGLSKSRIQAHRQCPRRLWLHVHCPELEEYDSGSAARFAHGDQIGAIARALHPGGVLIAGEDLRQALAETAGLLAQPPRPLFEATFEHQGVLVRADLLLPDGAGQWHLTEVKSSTRVKPHHPADVAIQAWVAGQAGLGLSRVEIAHIDTGFRYPGDGDYRGLIQHQEVSAEIAPLLEAVGDWVMAARETLDSDDPRTAPGAQCTDPFPCPFRKHCVPQAECLEGYPPELLPWGGAVGAALRAEGFGDLRAVPAGRLTNPRHQRIWQATCAGAPILDEAAGEALRALAWPRWFMDFETIQFAVPVWAGTYPYGQIPFQWSCHRALADGTLTHQGFLADGPDDPRRGFAQSLLEVLGDTGPILVYNATFERGRLRELAGTFPDLARALNAVQGRIVDLLPLTRRHYYHPEMRGSWSLKSVLPTIAPELGYADLEVADGGMAQAAFLEMRDPETSSKRRAQLREALWRYCERDTLALVRITEHFQTSNSEALKL